MSREDAFEVFYPSLVGALKKISDEYFNVVQFTRKIPEYFERAYCYELYYQLKCLLKKERELKRYSLFGEHPKLADQLSSKPWITPDFIFHNREEKRDNLVVIEVKHVRHDIGRNDDDKKTIMYAAEKLKRFLNADEEALNYFRGILLVYGDGSRDFHDSVVAEAVERYNDETDSLNKLIYLRHISGDGKLEEVVAPS